MPTPIDDYIAERDGEVAERLRAVAASIRAAVPAGTVEEIKWRMPAFMLGAEPLFFLTAAKRHVSFYPTSAAIAAFVDPLEGLATTEHAIQLPHAQPLPLDLVDEIVAWRVAQLPAQGG